MSQCARCPQPKEKQKDSKRNTDDADDTDAHSTKRWVSSTLPRRGIPAPRCFGPPSRRRGSRTSLTKTLFGVPPLGGLKSPTKVGTPNFFIPFRVAQRAMNDPYLYCRRTPQPRALSIRVIRGIRVSFLLSALCLISRHPILAKSKIFPVLAPRARES